MLKDAEAQFDRILALVAKCPEKLQEKCFEMLLAAYIAETRQPAKSTEAAASAKPQANEANTPIPAQETGKQSVVPEQLRSRFHAAASRLKVPVERLAGLFDFHLDPYNYHALAVPGEKTAEKCRNVAMLLCAKSYLTLGGWDADWKEFRAVCLDQRCYDKANMGTYLQKSGLFKTCSAAEGIALAAPGIAAAEELLAQLAGSPE